jgi:hypothetical protein
MLSTEGVVWALTRRDLQVELEQAAICLIAIMRYARRPSISARNRLIKALVEVPKIHPRAVIYLVVELRQADLTLAADLGTAS